MPIIGPNRFARPQFAQGFNQSHLGNTPNVHTSYASESVLDSWIVFGNSPQLSSVFTTKSTVTNTGTPTLARTSIGPAVNLTSAQLSGILRGPFIASNAPTIAAIIIMTGSAGGTIWTDGNFDMHVTGGILGAGCNGTAVSSGIALTTGVPYFVSYSWVGSVSNNLNFVVTNLNTGQIQTATFTSGTNTTLTSNQLIGTISASIVTLMVSQSPIGLKRLVSWANDPWSFWYPVRDPLFFGRVGFDSNTLVINGNAFDAPDVSSGIVALPTQINGSAFDAPDQAAGFLVTSAQINGSAFDAPDQATGVIQSILNLVGSAFDAPDVSNGFINNLFIPQESTYPPPGPTTQTLVIPSYIYQEYSDDDDLQAFAASYNTIAQSFIDTINALNLPIYTGLSGALLDWVGAGLYGYPRPALFSFTSRLIGPLNTWELNGLMLNFSEVLGASNVIDTSDDIYKRLLTWYIYKADGKYFTVRWLKRRIMRFLIGTDGSAPNIDQTYQISITFGSNKTVAIRFIDYETVTLASAQLNSFELNSSNSQLDYWEIENEPLVPLPNRDIFQDAVTSGAIELPFQYTWDVQL